MGIRNRQIGSSQEANLWYEVLRSVRSIRRALTPRVPVPNPNIGVLRIDFTTDLAFQAILYGSGGASITWGDGSPQENINIIGSNTINHNYTTSGNYSVTILFPDKSLLTGIEIAQGLTTIDIGDFPNITYVDLNAGVSPYQNVNSDVINNLLYTLDSNGLLGGTFQIYQIFNPAPPTVGPPNGIAAEANLVAKSWSITII